MSAVSPLPFCEQLWWRASAGFLATFAVRGATALIDRRVLDVLAIASVVAAIFEVGSIAGFPLAAAAAGRRGWSLTYNLSVIIYQ